MGRKSVKAVIKYCPKCKQEMELLGAGHPSCPTCQPSGMANKWIYYCPNCYEIEVEDK